MKALLFSGGVDSSALAFKLRPDKLLTINYGQQAASAEEEASKAISEALELDHEVLTIDCASVAQGDMSGRGVKSRLNPNSEWWPYRNQLLITIAAMRLIEYSPIELMVGTVQTDGVHRDGTQQFLDGMNALLHCQEGSMVVSAPAIHLSTEQLVEWSGITDAILGWTFSCHKGVYACGLCRGCLKRSHVLSLLGKQLP